MLDVIGRRQQDLLNLLLEQKDGLSIDQLAAELGISRNAVREHISALERDRLVEARAFTVTKGRPGRLYALSARGLSLFPKQYDLMARLLLQNMIARVGGEEAVVQLRALGAQLAQHMKARVGAGDLKHKAKAVAGLMRELGYEASAPNADAPTIEALNCVYHELAQADQKVCELDLALIGELAGADVEHRACMARGDNACVFCLKPSSPLPR